jgi:dienelactone hydrolase
MFICQVAVFAQGNLLTPPEIWSQFNPDEGDFKEAVISENTKDGILTRETYISVYILGEEVRVYCKYSVKKGAKNAPGLMDVHGWMGRPHISQNYVKDGWAVMAHDYCGKVANRDHYTKYPEKLRHGNMDRAVGPPIWSQDNKQKPITDIKQTSDYMWYAIQRRVLSYFTQQKEVDKTRLAAKGYSYGGTIMWNLGMDPRIKAIVAYFGIGWNEFYRSKNVWMYENPPKKTTPNSGEKIYLAGIAPQAHVPYIKAATLFLNGTNDHHGGHERGLESFKMFQKGVPAAFAQQARGHHNTEKIGQNTKIWLEKHVLGKQHFWAKLPQAELSLDNQGIPQITVSPDLPEEVEKVEIYYALKNPVSFQRNWRDTKAVRKGNTWTATLPVLNVDEYLFSFANIRYKSSIVLSTEFKAAIPAKLGNAVATDTKSSSFSGDGSMGAWTKVAPAEGRGGILGFRSIDNRRGSYTEQLGDPKWKAPKNSKLKFKFYCTQPQDLIFTANKHFLKEIKITASDHWQEMSLDSSELINRLDKKGLKDWSQIGKIHFTPKAGSDITKVIFADFKWIAK